jgi:hypothetical protein
LVHKTFLVFCNDFHFYPLRQLGGSHSRCGHDRLGT